MSSTELLAAKDDVQALRDSLVDFLDFRSVSKKRAKVPVNALLYLHGLEWRSYELSSNACDAFERGDIVAGILLTRAVTENAAAAWHLMELLTIRAAGMTDEALRVQTLRLLMGHRNDDAFPEAVNVLSMLDRASNAVPGAKANYDRLSEFAHPNWSGVMGSYIRTNKEALSADFGKNIRGRDQPLRIGVASLRAALAMLAYASSKTRTAIPALVARVEVSLSD